MVDTVVGEKVNETAHLSEMLYLLSPLGTCAGVCHLPSGRIDVVSIRRLDTIYNRESIFKTLVFTEFVYFAILRYILIFF